MPLLPQAIADTVALDGLPRMADANDISPYPTTRDAPAE